MFKTFDLNLNTSDKIKKMLPEMIKLVQYQPNNFPYKAVPVKKEVNDNII